MDNQNITLFVNSNGVVPTIYATQDDSGRQVTCLIADYQIPAGATAKFFAKKPSGLQIYNSATISGNSIIFPLTTQTLAELGIVLGQVEVTETDGTVSSFIFNICVRPSLSGDFPESENESTFLEQTLENMQNQINTSLATVDTATQAANTATENANTATQAANEAADAANEAAAAAGELPERVDNLYDMVNGVNTNSNAYSIDVPDGAKYATVDSIGGYSIVFNQLMPLNLFQTQTKDGITFTNNNDGTYTVNGTATAEAYIASSFSPVKKEHKYLLKGCPIGGNYRGTYCAYLATAATLTANDAGEGDIGEAIADGGSMYVIYVNQGVTVNNLIFRPQVFDLTQMFGAGNEPATVEEFEAMFPEQFYPYNAGEIVSAAVTNIKQVGLNLYSTAELTKIFANALTLESNENSVISWQCSNNPDNTILSGVFEENTQYTFILYGKCLNDSVTATNLRIYYADGTFSNLSFQSSGQYSYCVFTSVVQKTISEIKTIYTTVGTSLDLSKCAIVKGVYSSADNIPPYVGQTYPIPEAIQSLEGYGWSAGDVYNEVDFENKQYIQRVKKITLDGSESWTLMTSTGINQLYTNGIPSDAVSSGDGTVKTLNTQYTDISINDRAGNYNTCYTGSLGIAFNIENMTVEAWKEQLSANPLTVYYVTSEPIITDISDIISQIEVQPGGTITFEQSSYCLPVPTEVEFSLSPNISDLEERVSNLETSSATMSEDISQAQTDITQAQQNISQAQQDITQAQADITNLSNDYIIEQGTQSGWSYRKWHSGLAECWINKQTTVSYTFGNLVQGNTDLPFAFAETPVVTGSFGATGIASAYMAYMGSSTSTVDMYGSLPTGNEGTACWFNIYVIGQYATGE